MKLADKIAFDLLTFLPNSSDIVIPNFYYYSGYEMDVFRLLQSGYIAEYEIKISRSDFFSDFKKGTRFARKHDSLKEGKFCNRFWFVVPEGLVQKEEVPKHCGLLYYKDQWNFRPVKNAPLLHRNKINPSRYKGIALTLSGRDMFNKIKLRRLHNETKTIQGQSKAKKRRG